MKALSKILILIATLILLVLGMLTNIFASEIKIFENKELRNLSGLKYVPHEILVKFKSGVKEDKIDKFNSKLNTKIVKKSKYNKFLHLKIPAHKSVDSIVKQYLLNEDVLYAEPNYMARAFYTPNDTFYDPYQWNLMDTNSYDSGINMNSAWQITKGDASVIVAVIDTGVAYKNKNAKRGRNGGPKYEKAPDLANTLFVDESKMYDFINGDDEPLDDEGHGTHVTGTIAQSTNNNLGVAGIAFETTIMPIKVLDANGSGSYSAIADGIVFAADNGAKVINLSLGGPSHANVLKDAIDYAYYTKGVTIVCASGNDYEDGNPISYPAFYDECLTVGATKYDGTHSYYSSTGSHVDIAAPGGDVTVDQNGDGYGDGILQQTFGTSPTDWGYYFYQGTSMATPHVSAVAALLLANDPTHTPSSIREAIEKTARDIGSTGKDEFYGWGLLDAHAALLYQNNTNPVKGDLLVSSITLDSPLFVETEFNDVNVLVSNISGKVSSANVSLEYKLETDLVFTTIGTLPVSFVSGDTSEEVIFNWSTLGLSAGNYILKASLLDITGENDSVLNDSLTTPTTLEELPTGVETVITSMDERKQRNKYEAIANITTSQGDTLVEITWYIDGVFQSQNSGVSDANGNIIFVSNQERVKNSKTFKIVIDKVNNLTLDPKPSSEITIIAR